MAEKGKEQVTWVKLECSCSLESPKNLSKVQKLFNGFPQIRGQLFDEKSNMATIRVVCDKPGKIMDKLSSKKSLIKGLEVTNPPKEAEKPKEGEKPKEDEKPKEGEKPKPVQAVGQSSQAATRMHAPMIGQPVQPASQSSQAVTRMHAPMIGQPVQPAGQSSQAVTRMHAPMTGQPVQVAGQSSQAVTRMHTPMIGQPIYNKHYYHPSQEYGYPSNSVYNSYGGGAPPQPNYGLPPQGPQPNHPSNLVYNSYGGGAPPQPNHPYYGRSAFDQSSDENAQGCSIM